MIDLSYQDRGSRIVDRGWEPEEIAVAILALVIWLPLAFMIGGAL